jgi:hypothetical protein
MKLTLILSSMFVACSLHAQTIKELQSEIVQLQKQVATLQANKALALAPFVTVDLNSEVGVRGPNIVFSGANIHIVSGSLTTNDAGAPTGLGNLIIGYDEDPVNATVAPTSLNPGDRGGSHNLVIGRYHIFQSTAFGNLLAGERNFAQSEAGFLAGYANEVSGTANSVSGGSGGWAYQRYSSVCGGEGCWATEVCSTVLGGYFCR